MFRRAVITLVVVGAVCTSASAARAPIVYGYPYAARCPGAGIGDVVDRWGMYACNCTSYVAWALSANHQRTDWFIRGSMDAWNWPHVALLGGLTVDRAPAVGAVAVWPQVARPFGHVAYVTAVHANRTIDVAEYNFPGARGADTFGFETRSFVRPGDAIFIHVPRRSFSER
jgi:surface antigen